jgi:hypothetical protein
MTTFVPPQLIRSTGTLTVEKVVISPLTGQITLNDLKTDIAAAGAIARQTFIAKDSATNDTNYARVEVAIVDPTDASEDASYAIQTMVAGALASRVVVAQGVVVGAATGGDQGVGTLNATGLYINGAAVSANSGDVVGPASSTDNAVARFDLATGKLLQNSVVIIGDTGNITGVNDLTVTGDLTVNGTTATVNTTNLAVEDSLIQLARLNNATDAVDIGLVGLYDTSGSQDLYTGLFRDATDGKWKLFVSSQEDLSATNTVNTAATGYAVASLVANVEGALTGNASTATTLQTARNINGVSFNGSADITVTAAAGTLTGATLASNVLASSLTSVGTLLDLTVTNTITGTTSGNVANSLFDAHTMLYATTDNTPVALTVGASTFVGRKSTGNISAMTPAEARTELNVSSGANASSIALTVYNDGAEFTAGTSTTLTLSSTPAGEANVMVFFDGIFQNSTEWSFSGTTLTFSSAIPLGVSRIEIRLFTNA